MDTWLLIVEDFNLHKENTETTIFPDIEAVQKYSIPLWTKRLHPPSSDMDAICSHIDGLEKYTKLNDLLPTGKVDGKEI